MAVIVLSVLSVAAVAALVIGGIAKMSRTGRPAPTGTFQLPPGARILEMQSQPGRLILRVGRAGAEEIDIIDTQDGRLIGQVKAGLGDARSADPAR